MPPRSDRLKVTNGREYGCVNLYLSLLLNGIKKRILAVIPRFGVGALRWRGEY
jgi:hypothetical protein